MQTTKLAASLLVLFAAVFSATPTRAETVNCTAITSLPAVITVQGIYCFTGHLNTAMTSGNAIDIQTNNVVLDLNGFKLGGLAAGTGTHAFGIHALNRQNITIKNGTIRGFSTGITLTNNGASQGHVIEDIRADQNTIVGISVDGDGNIIRNNQVVSTGGGTCCGAILDGFGIHVFGTSARVLNNDVISVVKLGATALAWGIRFNACSGCLAVNNRVTEADKGIEYFSGATGKFRDNVTFDVTTPFTGGTNIGNNN